MQLSDVNLTDPDLLMEALTAQHRARSGVDGDVLDCDADVTCVEFAEFDHFDGEAVRRCFPDGSVVKDDPGVGPCHISSSVLEGFRCRYRQRSCCSVRHGAAIDRELAAGDVAGAIGG